LVGDLVDIFFTVGCDVGATVNTLALYPFAEESTVGEGVGLDV